MGTPVPSKNLEVEKSKLFSLSVKNQSTFHSF